MTPRKVRPNQVFQVFATILRLEFGTINVRVSIIKDKTEFAETVIQFDQPGSRMMQMVVRKLSKAEKIWKHKKCFNYPRIRTAGRYAGGVWGV